MVSSQVPGVFLWDGRESGSQSESPFPLAQCFVALAMSQAVCWAGRQATSLFKLGAGRGLGQAGGWGSGVHGSGGEERGVTGRGLGTPPRDVQVSRQRDQGTGPEVGTLAAGGAGAGAWGPGGETQGGVAMVARVTWALQARARAALRVGAWECHA